MRLRLLPIMVLLAIAAGAHAQVIGVQPTPMGIYGWDSSTLVFDKMANTYSLFPQQNTPQPFAFFGWNSLLGMWTPCDLANSTCKWLSGPTVIEVNGVASTPTSPVNYINSGTVTWNISGNQISATSAQGSVSNSDGTLTISPTTGAVVASLALGHANTWTATQTFNAALGFDASGSTQIKLPVAGGYTSAAGGEIGFDSTNNNWHAWTGADSIMIPLASGFTSGHCAQPTLVGPKWVLSDIGAACGSAGAGVTSVSNSDSSLVISPTTGAAVASLNAAHANTWTATQTLIGVLGFDASGSTQIKLPVAGEYTSAAGGEIGFDSTNNNWHAWTGADSIMVPLASGFTSGHCAQPTVSGGKWVLNDTGSACGSAGGAVTCNGAGCYQTLPGGLIVEFVSTGTLNNNVPTTVSLPLTIPTSIFAINCNDNGSRVQTGNVMAVGANLVGLSAPYNSILVATPATGVSAYCTIWGN